jgi:tripartite-type tricarboxylate transporter receptor subunit TctC
MKKKSRTLLIYLVMGFFCLLGTGNNIWAGEYPEKPVKLIVPWAAGGDTDVLMRIIAHYAGKYLGQPMVVVNVGGVGEPWGRVKEKMLNQMDIH